MEFILRFVYNNPRVTNTQQQLFYLKTYTTARDAALLKYIKVEDNAYTGVLDTLRKRFDRKDQIVNHQIPRFCKIPNSTFPTVGSPGKLHESADDVKRALEALHRGDRDCVYIYLLLANADAEIRQK